MKRRAWLLLALLTALPACAKPKVDVRVKVNEGIGRDRAADSLSKNNHPTTDNTMIKETVWFLNVTVVSDNTEAVAKGNGQWCITGSDEALDVNGEYRGTLDGNSLEILVFLKNGKVRKEHFEIFDHKWRKLSDL
jgi:hypothetical protein